MTASLPPGLANLFLIGYRGSGKTAVARIVAQRLAWTCVDADSLLEKRHGCTIAQIFAAEGEAGFRDKEAALLEEICQDCRQVVATGGGVILRPANRQRLRASGRSVWLTADAQTLWQRLQADCFTAQRRPNLTVGGLAEVEELLRIREPFYRACADWVVETTAGTPQDVAERIVEQILDCRF